MSKQNRKARTRNDSRQKPVASMRASTIPFCAYYGPRGETCGMTQDLSLVFSLPGSPPIEYMACSLHYGAVRQQVNEFLARSQVSPQTISFSVQGVMYTFTVAGGRHQA
jgi:hypothetical protein